VRNDGSTGYSSWVNWVRRPASSVTGIGRSAFPISTNPKQCPSVFVYRRVRQSLRIPVSAQAQVTNQRRFTPEVVDSMGAVLNSEHFQKCLDGDNTILRTVFSGGRNAAALFDGLLEQRLQVQPLR
jgi:hypothetical protein